jgi:hypothetical protein
MAGIEEPFVLQVTPLTGRQRRHHYLRVLQRPRMLVALVLLASFPALLDRATALLIPSGPLSLSLLGVGVAGVLGLVALTLVASEIVAFARHLFGRDAGSLVFDDSGVGEICGRRVTHHAWSWVAEAWTADGSLVLSCHEPMRTLRLGAGGRRSFLVDRRTPGVDRLERLLEVHRPGLLRR